MPRPGRPTYKVAPSILSEVQLQFDQTGLSQEVFGRLESVRTSRDTVGNFLKGLAIDSHIFTRICKELGRTVERTADEFLSSPNQNSTDTTDADAAAYDLLPDPPYEVLRSGAKEFVGRDSLLEKLHEALEQNQIVAVNGMGGIGKTELGIQYVERYKKHYQGGVCWVYVRQEDAPGHSSVARQIVSFAVTYLGINIPAERSKEFVALKFCFNNWHSGKVLLVFDDVEHYRNEIHPYIPQGLRFKILITTRLSGLTTPCISFPVDVLDRDDSLKMLSALAENGKVETEPEAANLVCDFLGDLPLGVELAGRYLKNSFDTIQVYLEKICELASRREALIHTSFKRKRDDPKWSLTAERDVEDAFQLSWMLLDADAQNLAKSLGRFAPAPIPWFAVEEMNQVLIEEFPDVDSCKLEKLIESRDELINLSLIQLTKPYSCRIHSLVREFFRNKISDDDYEKVGDFR